MRKYVLKLVFLVQLLSVFIASTLTGSVSCYAQDSGRVVRIGFFPMNGYNEILSNGTYAGMDVEYLENISTYTGWTIEYVDCESWDDALSKLEARQVDLVGSAQFSKERSEKFAYASLPSGHTFGVIAVSQDSDYAYEDFIAMKGIRYGIVGTYVRKKEFIDYLKENGITNPAISEYESTEKLREAFDAGEIDAYVHTFTEIEEGQRIIGRFAPNPFYYISYIGNGKLLDELNQAIADLKINQPELENDLLNKYYESKFDKTLVFTTAEKNFIASKDKLRIGYIDAHYPSSYSDNGEFMGLAREQADQVAEQLGLVPEYILYENSTEAAKALKYGEIDFMSFATSSDVAIAKSNLKKTVNYLTIPAAIISPKAAGEGEIHAIAVIKELESKARTLYDNPDIKFLVFPSTNECLDAVANGDSDIAVCDAYLAEYMLDIEDDYYTLKLQSVANMDYGVFMVYSDEEQSELGSILKKTISPVSDKVLSEYMMEHNARRFISIRLFIRKYSSLIMGIVLLIFIIVIAVLIHMRNDGKKIQQLMYKDFSMDVWNMNYLTYKANENLPITGRTHFAIVYINISQFRKINSLYGWKRGQELLEFVVDFLKNELDQTGDIFARDQGDRFVLFMKYDFQSNLAKRIENVKAIIEDELQREFSLHMTLVIGICVVPSEEKDIEKVIANASVAMDEARESNGTDLVFYDDRLEKSIKEEHHKEQILNAVDFDNDFVAYYQAKVDIRTKKIIGAEALVRFIDRSDGNAIKSPFFFVPYYERTGKIIDIDFKVLESVCQMLSRRIAAGKKIVTVSVNFSRYHFMGVGFADKFESVLAKYGISKDLIEVEVTETVVMDDMQRSRVKNTLDDLHSRDIRISIDDFGSGYSSLGIFEQIPASVIKLDRSFLLNHENKERQVAIMRGVVNLAENLHATVICEGVETDGDVDLMKEIGAYIAQGYKFSKPVNEETFEMKLDMQQD